MEVATSEFVPLQLADLDLSNCSFEVDPLNNGMSELQLNVVLQEGRHSSKVQFEAFTSLYCIVGPTKFNRIYGIEGPRSDGAFVLNGSPWLKKIVDRLDPGFVAAFLGEKELLHYVFKDASSVINVASLFEPMVVTPTGAVVPSYV